MKLLLSLAISSARMAPPRTVLAVSSFCVMCFAALSGLCVHAAQAETTAPRDLFADTWVASDALGRSMPLIDIAGEVKTDQPRVVGIFYITWHTQGLGQGTPPYQSDVTKILAEHPEARLDAQNPAWKGGSFHWGEPEMGYFLSQDTYVIRKDMSMLSDAGVDVIILDVTNAVRYWDEWEVLFTTMEQMKAEGNPVPKFCFWSFNGPSITVVQDLYDRIYKENRFPDLWFYWDGKPLLLYNSTPNVDANTDKIQHPNPHYDPAAKTDPNHPHYGDPDYADEFYRDYTKEVREFFTLRTMWWGYYKWAGKRFIGTEDTWSFGYDMGDQNVQKMTPLEMVSKHAGQLEEAAVTPAQHPSSLIGKSWTKEHGEPELDEHDLPKPTFVPWLGKTVEHPEAYGIYFQDRWEEALSVQPRFLYINDWNEWTAGKYHEQSTLDSINFMRRGKDATYFFVDQYNSEFNRCIQPMKGGYTDNYYMQMAQNIRRYKGVRPIPVNRGTVTLTDGKPLSTWDHVEVEYRDTYGDTFHRDHPGYSGLHYVDTTGRNDVVTSKIAVDADNLYVMAETAERLTPATDPNWMLLFIDTDQNPQTGWFGYELLVNQNVVNTQETTLKRWNTKSQTWDEADTLAYQVVDNRLAITLPRSVLGATTDQIQFDFKWSDNAAELRDPISFCTAGDTAPNRRFNYRFLFEAK